MEGALTPERETGGTPGGVVRFIVLFVSGWVAALLALALLELAIDPDIEKRSGELLDLASVIVAVLGLIAVPIGVAAFARTREATWPRAGAFAAAALVLYLVGVAIDLAVYAALERR